MGKKRKMPSKLAIKKEWEGKFRFIEDFGWKELSTDACWRCGTECTPDRAHIWARWCMEIYTDKTDEEMDDVSNLHLLCSSCHKYSETIAGWAPGLAYYEWFYSLRESPQDNPMLPQIWRENRYYGLMVTNEMAKNLGIDTLNQDRELTDKENKMIKEWLEKYYDGSKMGETILYEDRYKKYLSLPENKKELACFDPTCVENFND
tara:strand:- start:211 stop:825 length:615 start_codon:yes stop_codon:yes gene_type:complete